MLYFSCTEIKGQERAINPRNRLESKTLNTLRVSGEAPDNVTTHSIKQRKEKPRVLCIIVEPLTGCSADSRWRCLINAPRPPGRVGSLSLFFFRMKAVVCFLIDVSLFYSNFFHLPFRCRAVTTMMMMMIYGRWHNCVSEWQWLICRTEGGVTVLIIFVRAKKWTKQTLSFCFRNIWKIVF